jgi:lipopolysaccharide biosynthesis protein
LGRRVPSTFRVEAGAVPTGPLERVAVVAQFSESAALSRSFQTLVEALVAEGFFVIVSSTTQAEGSLAWPAGRPENVAVLRRPNVGYDFGSWAVVINAFPRVREAGRVLVVNDSLVGPFTALTALVADFESAAADVWGAVRSHQFAPHLQSYFLGFRNGALALPPIRSFWRSISVQGTKTDVIWKYELGFSAMLRAKAIPTATAFDGADLVGEGLNPAILGWHALLEAGFPFVKRELLTRPDVAPDSAELPQVIRAKFDEDVAAWL